MSRQEVTHNIHLCINSMDQTIRYFSVYTVLIPRTIQGTLPQHEVTLLSCCSSAAGSAAGMITMDKATLERKLSSFERTSTDPNASAVAEAIRALILN